MGQAQRCRALAARDDDGAAALECGQYFCLLYDFR
jgi:hypothetical protein